MNDNTLSKDTILSKIDTHQVINYYLQPYHNKASLKQGQHISNPFLSKKQKTPSFAIYKNKQGYWCYKDFATDHTGNVFDLVMQLQHCTFKEALEIINSDFSLDLTPHKQTPTFEIECNSNTETVNFSYWHPYGIQKQHLEHFNVKEVIQYTRTLTSSPIRATDQNPIFGYQITESCYKIYTPLVQKYRFSWLGSKPDDYVFGYRQLPRSGSRVFITGGEKDVIALYAHGEHAICFNSETAHPPQHIIQSLKQGFSQVIVLYDLDATGIAQSQKIAQHYQLHRMVLPTSLTDKGGKDIADFFKLGCTLDDPDITIEDPEYSLEIEPPTLSKEMQTNVARLFTTKAKLTKLKGKIITKAQPIITYEGNGIIYPRTMTLIQGKAGVHKSRLAETISSVLIQDGNRTHDLLGLERNSDTPITVCYVDTERNLTDQFPYALQQILIKAGYQKEDTPPYLDYISLLEISRAARFDTLKAYLDIVRAKTKGHMVIILDVVTDCISDFNRASDSLELSDMMNAAINTYDVTFIGLIHENPGSVDKARGHLGTELNNKTSSTMQIGYEKDKNGNTNDLIKISVLKLRNDKRPEPIYCMYSEDAKGLVIADENMIQNSIHSRKTKADLFEVQHYLSKHLIQSTPSKCIIDELSANFDCSTKVIRERLKEFTDKVYHIPNAKETPCWLTKIQKGKEVFYELVPS